MKIRIFLYLFCFSAILAVASPAQSGEYFDTKITPEEQAVFAFFRASEDAPDFDFWITSKKSYRALPEDKKENFLVRETMRLGHGYGMYDLDTDLLEIKVNTLSQYFPAKDGKQPHLTFRFLNIGKDITPAFNYRFGSGYISMIIDRLDFFSNVSQTPERDKALREKIPYEDDEFDSTLEIHVRISKADYDVFVEEDGIKQWAMIGEIAYIKCEVESYYTQQTYILWDYVAPWYKENYRIKNMPEEQKYPHPYDLFRD